jgi:voltage-gated potassium channel
MAETGDARWEREELRERLQAWTETPLNVLGIVLLAVIVAEFALDLPPGWRSVLDALNWFIYLVFALDFVVQLALATDKIRYVRRNWIAAISVLLPAFRVLRVLRAVRLLRGLRLVRVLTATNRGTRSMSRMLRGHQFGRVMGLTIAVVFVGAAALVYFEDVAPRAYGDALWWSIAFVTTVGSDFQPATLEGRIVTLLLVVWGLGVFGYITAAVASYFVGKDSGTDAHGATLADLRREITELRVLLATSPQGAGEGQRSADTPPPTGEPAP